MAKILPFGRKAGTFGIRNPVEDPRITILEGSVRSSKTWAMHIKLLMWLNDYNVGGRRVIVGQSKGSVFRNILIDLFDIVGKENYDYNTQSGELTLFGQQWFVIGAKDEGSAKQIQGMTIGVLYIDEGTNIPRSFFLMALTRMSPAGARAYVTTNPDNPFHWLKTEFIENRKLIAKGGIKTIHFTLDDNPTLDEEYKENLKLQFHGVFYMRYILGLWVVAEGAIYRDVWTKVAHYSATPNTFWTDGKVLPMRPIGLDGAGGYQQRTIACDYGTHNPTVFLDIRDTGKKIMVDREYYWDSVAESRQKDDAEYLADLLEFIGPDRRGVKVLIDPSALSFITACQNAGLWVVSAENDVLEGIRRTSSVLGLGVVEVNETCINFEREMQVYAWDEKKAKKGDEEPIKLRDHCPDAFRYYCFTEIPTWRLSTFAMAA